jgi:hypothetical protein
MTLPDTLIEDALTRLGFRTDDYLLIAERFTPAEFIRYMEMAYAVGYEKAMFEYKDRTASINSKPVTCTNELGLDSKPYRSVQEAANSVCVSHKKIRYAIRTGRTLNGYKWKYVT